MSIDGMVTRGRRWSITTLFPADGGALGRWASTAWFDPWASGLSSPFHSLRGERFCPECSCSQDVIRLASTVALPISIGMARYALAVWLQIKKRRRRQKMAPYMLPSLRGSCCKSTRQCFQMRNLFNIYGTTRWRVNHGSVPNAFKCATSVISMGLRDGK